LATLGDSSHVVLSTYPRLRIDSAQFTAVAWSMVVLDEAHAIKNTGTQTADVVHSLKSRLRLALTGTPVENRAEELWSLMNWLNPGYLGDQASFCHYTSIARSSAQKRFLMAPLRVCLDPLILRRLKKDPEVALGLPDKVFEDLTCELSIEQQQLYQSVLEICVAEGTETLSLFQRRAIYLRAILHLKQICIHPDLFFESAKMRDLGDIPEFQTGKPKKWAQKIQNLRRKTEATQSQAESLLDRWTKRSGKLQAFSDLITDQQLQCRGILIFTQYLGAAEMLQRVISRDYEKPVPPLIHGGLTPAKRQELVDEFNAYCYGKGEDNQAPILILSLKAGGTGLNLTGADCVIHCDRWWNPAVEDQATDRAHRIGQTSQVFVQTLTSSGTIEESIADKFESKRKLSADLLGAVTDSDFGDQLKDDATFLQLVDPKGIFRKTLRIFDSGV
jgi:SNF2 family DNA or RNA helicase